MGGYLYIYYLVRMNIPTPNCNEEMDDVCRQLTTSVLTPKRIRL